MGIVKIAEGEKVGKKSKKVENNYVNNTKILPHFFTQKRSVEKVVENVEKSIPPRKKTPNGRGKPSTKMPFFQEKQVFRSCNNYVLRKRKLSGSSSSFLMKKLVFSKTVAVKNQEKGNSFHIFW